MKIIFTKSCRSSEYSFQDLPFGQICSMLSTPKVVDMDLSDYLMLDKDEQTRVKDVGAYLFGTPIHDNSKDEMWARKQGNVKDKEAIVIDIDGASGDFLQNLTLRLNFAYFVHSTFKPNRYRVIIPIGTPLSGDEYHQMYRYVCMKYFYDEVNVDLSTKNDNSLFFLPACTRDRRDAFFTQRGVGEELYVPNHEVVSFLQKKEVVLMKSQMSKRGDPKKCKGYVGAFNKEYSISEAIEEFLSDVYEVGTENGRYTYTKGSTANGMLVFDDEYAYSYHATDPATCKLVNAFELVAIHRFTNEYLVSGLNPKGSCIHKMFDFCAGMPKLKANLIKDDMALTDVPLENWEEQLDQSKGKIVASDKNIQIIFNNDPVLKNMFYNDNFDKRYYVRAGCRFNQSQEDQPIDEFTMSLIEQYFGITYGIEAYRKINNAFKRVLFNNTVDTLYDYVSNTRWDGKERVETSLTDYLGCEDTPYARACAKMFFVGAVARACEAGCKADQVLILSSKEGVGKSTFFERLGGKFFSDTFGTFKGKEAFEQIQGKWIIEMAELSAWHGARAEEIKHFISKQVDNVRLAYWHNTEPLKRRCVFVGTTNEVEILTDETGNRRFLPVQVDVVAPTKNVFNDLTEEEVNQLWAEAYQMYLKGEKWHVAPNEVEKIQEGREKFEVENPRLAQVQNYLNTRLPTKWDDLSKFERCQYFMDEERQSIEGEKKRDKVSVIEVWCECFQKRAEDLDKTHSIAIGKLLLKAGFDKGNPMMTKAYGSQRIYRRKKDRYDF